MASRPVEVVLTVRGRNVHLQTLFTGFQQLHAQGEIRLRQVFRAKLEPPEPEPPWLTDVWTTHLEAVIDGHPVLYDCHDSTAIRTDLPDGTEVCFKRACPPGVPEATRLAVVPLGLIYPVTTSGFDRFELLRVLRLHGNRRELVGSIGLGTSFPDLVRFRPETRVLEAIRPQRSDARVLFVSRLWDPDDYAPPPDIRQDMERLNQLRIDCARALRAHLGPSCTTGLADTAHARAVAPDLVLEPHETSPAAFVANLARHTICVTTGGLHGSNGFKLGEFVAAGRAIVCETPEQVVPGQFAHERNYLGFGSADACVAHCDRLVADADLREHLADENRSYYDSHVRPDALVRRTVAIMTGAGSRE